MFYIIMIIILMSIVDLVKHKSCLITQTSVLV